MYIFEPNIIGIMGALLIVLAYSLLQLEKLAFNSLAYSLTNLIGSLLLIYSLLYNWNFPSVLIEIFWLLISTIGLVKWAIRHRNNNT
jgi:hypothetical protein